MRHQAADMRIGIPPPLKRFASTRWLLDNKQRIGHPPKHQRAPKAGMGKNVGREKRLAQRLRKSASDRVGATKLQDPQSLIR